MSGVKKVYEYERDGDDEDMVEFMGVFMWKTVVRRYCDVRVVVGALILVVGWHCE